MAKDTFSLEFLFYFDVNVESYFKNNGSWKRLDINGFTYSINPGVKKSKVNIFSFDPSVSLLVTESKKELQKMLPNFLEKNLTESVNFNTKKLRVELHTERIEDFVFTIMYGSQKLCFVSVTIENFYEG